MNVASPVAQTAAFAGRGSGHRLRLVTEPQGRSPCGTVIALPAFAEEMNKSRRMSARMARALAADDWRVAQIDLLGCGDSSGEFRDATWDAWIEDLRIEIAMAASDGPIWLWCTRAGALLAAPLLDGHPDLNLLLWQPVLSGTQHLKQFLRLHAGARILGSSKGDDEAGPMQRLCAGATVEVGGYELSPALALGLERASFDIPAGHTGRVVWFELSVDEQACASPASARLMERLAGKSIAPEFEALQGPPFWQTQEIEESEALLERTRLALGSAAAQGRAIDAPTLASQPPPGDDPAAISEEMLGFACGADRLWGVLARPPASSPAASTGVVIAVGGPQYRVGSHRQFVLLARRLAGQGYCTLRFDYRGMGDSEGEMRGFEEAGPDLQAAIAAMRRACPDMQRIVVWGLCDAASAALMHATRDPAVVGIVAANPWVRSTASLAAAQVRHYYAARLMQREFWTKLLHGGLDWRASLSALASNLHDARDLHRPATVGRASREAFQDRMARGLRGFHGRALLILSGQDLTAQEFLQYTASAASWRGLLEAPKVQRVNLPQADHTFSSRAWQDKAEEATLAWLQELVGLPAERLRADAAAPERDALTAT